MIIMRTYLWHTTKLSSVKRIMKEGLTAMKPAQRPNKPKGVYLSEYMLEWMKNTTIDGCNGAVLKINTKGLKIIEDKEKDYSGTALGKSYICLSDIPPSRIVETLAETRRGFLQHIVV